MAIKPLGTIELRKNKPLTGGGEFTTAYIKRLEKKFDEVFNTFRAVEEPLDIEGASKFLKMAKGTLENKVNGGVDIPYHIAPDGKKYFYRSELNDWIRKNDVPDEVEKYAWEVANNLTTNFGDW